MAARARHETLVACGAIAIGVFLAVGAWSIPGQAGYSGVGPNFLPWLVSAALVLCGALLLREARSGGFGGRDEPDSAVLPDWAALSWVAAGIACVAALITTIGFILACTLCFMLAVRGLRGAEGKPHGGLSGLALDFVTGFLIAAPAYWLFTKVLAINLPGLTRTGWI